MMPLPVTGNDSDDHANQSSESWDTKLAECCPIPVEFRRRRSVARRGGGRPKQLLLEHRMRRTSWRVHLYAEHEEFLESLRRQMREQRQQRKKRYALPTRSDILRYSVERLKEEITGWNEDAIEKFVTRLRRRGTGKCEATVSFAISPAERETFGVIERYLRSRGIRQGVSEAAVARMALSLAASDPDFVAELAEESFEQKS